MFVATNVAALGSRVILELDEVPEVTEGGIIIADTAKSKPASGTIRSIGPLVQLTEWPLQVGDRVHFTRYSGAELEIDGESVLAIDVSDLIAKEV